MPLMRLVACTVHVWAPSWCHTPSITASVPTMLSWRVGLTELPCQRHSNPPTLNMHHRLTLNKYGARELLPLIIESCCCRTSTTACQMTATLCASGIRSSLMTPSRQRGWPGMRPASWGPT